MSQPARTVSLGCRLNAYEAERMAVLAARHGEGGSVIVNTCAVTSEAARQSRQAIRRAARGGARVVATGCAVQTDPDGFAAMPEVARVIGNGVKLEADAWAAPAPQPPTLLPDVFAATDLPRAPAPAEVQARAHLAVQDGCDHRCTFCVIPYGRGASRSKAPGDVCAEALAVAALGAREVVLTGVDLTSYEHEGQRLGAVVEALLRALPTDVHVRLSSIDGAEVDDQLFGLLTTEPRVAPYAHLSLQAGDDMILKRMKRRHTRADAVALCDRLRAARSGIALGADLIAGFPTETDAMADRTLALIADCGLTYTHVFPYSPRPGTPAARMPQVAREVVKARAARLREAASAALTARLDAMLGTPITALVESVADGAALARTPCFAEAELPTDGVAVGQRLTIMPQARNGRRLRAVRTSS